MTTQTVDVGGGMSATWDDAAAGSLTFSYVGGGVSDPGVMNDYGEDTNQAPWRASSDFITGITFCTEMIAIGAYAFTNMGITSVEFPSRLERIGEGAFKYTRLSGTLTFNSAVRVLGNNSFSGIHVSSIVLPDMLMEVGDDVFSGCSYLTSCPTFPSKMTYLGLAMFAFCNSLTGDVTIPAHIKEVRGQVFWQTAITSLTFEEGVETVGYTICYDDTSLTSVTFCDSITEIGDYAFRGCSNMVFNHLPASLVTIGESAFQDDIKLTGMLTIPSKVRYVEQNAFNGCYSLSGIITEGPRFSVDSGSFALNPRTPVITYTMESLWANDSIFTETVRTAYTVFNYVRPDNIVRIKVDSEWRNGIPYIKVGGVWMKGAAYIKVNGVWKESI